MSGYAGVVQADHDVELTVGVATFRLANSGIGDDDDTGCVVEAKNRCSDEESGKTVEDARRAEVSKIRSQKGKKMGR